LLTGRQVDYPIATGLDGQAVFAAAVSPLYVAVLANFARLLNAITASLEKAVWIAAVVALLISIVARLVSGNDAVPANSRAVARC
jgi:hypothetical protein